MRTPLLTRLILLGLCCSFGCATSKPAVSSPAPTSEAAQAPDATSNETLALAFDPHAYEAMQNAKAAKRAKPGGTALAGNSAKEDAPAAARARLEARLSELRKALSRRKLDDVPQQLNALRQEAKEISPQLELEVEECAIQYAQLTDIKSVEKAVQRGLRACGPEGVALCRERLLKELPERSAVRRKIQEHDLCVKKAESARTLPPCAKAATAFYNLGGDHLMVARLLLASAEGAEAKGASNAVAQFAAAERACETKQCGSVRRAALLAQARLYSKAKDFRGAARAALAEARMQAESLPDEERVYARTALSEAACEKLDEKEGAGSCHQLEKALFSGYTFKDFSRLKSTGEEGLSPAEVKQVNAHYSVLISECLAARAAQLVPPDYERHGMHWTVGNTGRVTRVQMDRNADEGTELSHCLANRLAVFRYPRFSGEQQNLSQSFLIQASERRWHETSR